jgi:hypothetical protein
VQRPQRPSEIEGPVVERELRRVALDEADVREPLCPLASLLEQLGNEVDPHDLADMRRQREGERSRAGARVKRSLIP